VLDFTVKELGYQEFQIKQNNYFMDLPVELIVNGKAEKMMLGKEGIKVKSMMPPTVDPNGYYLKKVTLL
jgi:hypothetical protein